MPSLCFKEFSVVVLSSSLNFLMFASPLTHLNLTVVLFYVFFSHSILSNFLTPADGLVDFDLDPQGDVCFLNMFNPIFLPD